MTAMRQLIQLLVAECSRPTVVTHIQRFAVTTRNKSCRSVDTLALAYIVPQISEQQSYDQLRDLTNPEIKNPHMHGHREGEAKHGSSAGRTTSHASKIGQLRHMHARTHPHTQTPTHARTHACTYG